jgi:hypothetical protein
MCLAGQAFASAPKGVQSAFNILAPGIGLASKVENKLYEKTMPTAGKEMMDRFMPDKMRKGILANGDKGARATLSNPNSEADEARGKIVAANEQLRVNQAWANQYNNQVRSI